MSHFDEASLSIKCPKCGHKFKKTVAALKGKGNICPKCGVVFDTSKFRRGVADADRAIEKFKRDLAGSFKMKMKF